MVPTTAEEFFNQTQSRLAALERHRHAAAATGGGGIDFTPGFNMEMVGDQLDFHVYVQNPEPAHRVGTLWYPPGA
jgi:hypothetical protein